MPATFPIPLINVIPGQIITALLWNNEYGNIYTNFVPAGMDDYSANDSQMQTATDPYPGGATSRPTSLQGEIERLRYILAQITGKTYWYVDVDVDIATFKTRFDAHTHDGTANQGPQITSSGLASNAVTTAKITDSNVTTAKIADGNVTNAKLADGSVDSNKLAASVAGNGLSGGGGSALAVNTDNSTIEINSDTLRVKDGGITAAKLVSTLQPASSKYTGAVLSGQASSGSTTILSTSGPTVIKGIAVKIGVNPGSGSATWRIGINVDGAGFVYTGAGFVTGGALNGSVQPGDAASSSLAISASTSPGTQADLDIACASSCVIIADPTSFTDGRWQVNVYVTYHHA